MEDNFNNIKSSPKMMIGTVQFGIPYGIANNQGQPSNEEVMAIMKHAHESGVDEYDTAAAYGESEKRLGYNFKELGITKNVSVYTKIKPLRAEISKSPKESEKAIIHSLEQSLRDLKIECLKGVLFHREEDAIYLDILQRQKDLGKCEAIGISCGHHSHSVKEWIKQGLVDALQIPANIMDKRHFEIIYSKENQNKIMIFLRSIFLQGILTMKNSNIPVVLKKLKPLHLKYSTLAHQTGMSLKEFALRVMMNSCVRSIILGNDSLKQFKENLAFIEKGPLPNDIMDQINECDCEVDPKWVTPSLWPSSDEA